MLGLGLVEIIDYRFREDTWMHEILLRATMVKHHEHQHVLKECISWPDGVSSGSPGILCIDIHTHRNAIF